MVDERGSEGSDRFRDLRDVHGEWMLARSRTKTSGARVRPGRSERRESPSLIGSVLARSSSQHASPRESRCLAVAFARCVSSSRVPTKDLRKEEGFFFSTITAARRAVQPPAWSCCPCLTLDTIRLSKGLLFRVLRVGGERLSQRLHAGLRDKRTDDLQSFIRS